MSSGFLHHWRAGRWRISDRLLRRACNRSGTTVDCRVNSGEFGARITDGLDPVGCIPRKSRHALAMDRGAASSARISRCDLAFSAHRYWC